MASSPEGEVLGVLSGEIELRGIRVSSLVAIRGAENGDDELAALHAPAAELAVLGDPAREGSLDRAVEAQELLDGGRQERRDRGEAASSSSGCERSARTAFAIRLTVVSCPATISRTTML